MARSGHYNHQRHARQQAQFFALVEADRQARQRQDAEQQALEDFQRWARGESDPERTWTPGSFDHLQLHTMEYDDAESEECGDDDDAWHIWDTQR